MNQPNSKRSPIQKRAIAIQDGRLGEDLVRDWLRQDGWQVLYQRWRCRWGELDLIAHNGQDILAFVEVKVRGQGSWDRNGLLSVTAQKQAKLCKAAQLFLSEHPEFADCFCRFDVALVSWKNSPKQAVTPPSSVRITWGSPILYGSVWLTLEQYIAGAFDALTES